MTCPSCGKELISTGIYLREEDLTTLEFLNYKEEASKQVESLLVNFIKESDSEEESRKIINNLLDVKAGMSLLREKFFKRLESKYNLEEGDHNKIHIVDGVIYKHAQSI